MNPVVALVAMIWAGGLFHERWNNLQRPLAAAAGFGLMALAVPLPWVVRNQVVLGVPVIKNALGVNLHVSNNDCASSSFILNLRSGCLGKHSPDANRAEADLVADMGEGRYDAYRLNTAKSWISAHPGIFCRLTAQRVLEFWFPNVAEGPFAYTIATITLLSLAGFVLMARQDVLFLRFAVWTSLLYPLVYYVVFSDSRYRIPILWISLLGAGYCLQAWWERYCLWRRSRDNGRQAGASARHTAP
ncbi:MAG: hypothetical protein LLG20_05925 [Acidobacteriales bacterium]|nr:hypothetical protein [Terriglobales bacterium]